MAQKLKPFRLTGSPADNPGELSFIPTNTGDSVKGFLAGNAGVPLPFFSGMVFLSGTGTLPPDPPQDGTVYVNLDDKQMYFAAPGAGSVYAYPIQEGSILAKVYYESAQTPVSSFGTTPETMLTMSRNFTPGVYMVDLTYGWTCDNTTQDFIGVLSLDGSPLGQPHQQEPKDAAGTTAWTNTNQTHFAMKRMIVDLTSGGNRTLDFSFRCSGGGIEVSAFDAAIMAWNLTELNL